MELKYVNLNSDNAVVSNLNNINSFFLKIVKIEFKNRYHVFFSYKLLLLLEKQNSSYCSPHRSTIKASLVNMDL
jgi:hypothetical protein